MNTFYRLFFFYSLFFAYVSSHAQNVSISGKVLDKEEGTALPGVNVIIVNDNKSYGGAVTDLDGNFVTQAPIGTKLRFSFIGFETIFLPVDREKSGLVINMVIDEDELDEVVIVGYQEKRKEDVAGAIDVVEAKELQEAPVANVMELMQGKVAGLNIQNNNGTPGVSGTITIRGISTVNVTGAGNEALLTPTPPLFVVDGVPIDDPSSYEYGFQQSGPGISPLSLIPVEDIAEIQVLKDAQATSLYGSRGAYGVILITTKRGQSKVPIISYSNNFFISTPPPLRDVIVGKGERWLRMEQIIAFDTSYSHALELISQNAFLSDSLNPYYNNSTDWQELFYRTTYNQSHNISFSGGDVGFNYKVNAGYYNSEGVVKNTGFDRYSLRMNMGYRPNDKFSLNTFVNTTIGLNSKGSGNSLAQSGIAEAGNTSSLLPPPSLYTASNASLGAISIINNNKTVGISTNISVDYRFSDGIKFGNTLGYSYNTSTEDTFYPALLNNDRAELYAYNSVLENLYNRTNLNFTKTIADKHDFGLYFFQELSFSNRRGSSITQTGLANDLLRGPFGYDRENSGGSAESADKSRSVGYSSSFSYNFDSRYVLNFSYRIDGSSTTGPEVPWRRSPSIGLRWNIHNENFLKDVAQVSFASIRASWGKSIIPSGNISQIYGSYNTGNTYNGVNTISIDLGTMPNESLVPSVSTTWNLGVDAGFYKGRLGFTFETYYKQVDRILREKEIANHNGFSVVNTNETSIVNYGYELSLNLRPLPAYSKLDWRMSFSGAINKDIMAALPGQLRQIISEGGDTDQPVVNRLGTNTLSNYLLHYRGVYENDSDVPVDPVTGLRYRTGGVFNQGRFFRAGDPIWTDLNGDYILDNNDRVIVGNSQPRFTGGAYSQWGYGPFTITMNVSFTIGRDVLNNAIAERFKSFDDPLSQTALVPIDSYNYWKSAQEGDNENKAEYPNPFDFTRNNLYYPFRYDQTLFQEDGSYVKINTVSCSYNLNRKFTEKYGINSVRLKASVNNVYTFSKYSGPNPEAVSGLGRDSSGGYPPSRNYSVGISVQF